MRCFQVTYMGSLKDMTMLCHNNLLRSSDFVFKGILPNFCVLYFSTGYSSGSGENDLWVSNGAVRASSGATGYEN